MREGATGEGCEGARKGIEMKLAAARGKESEGERHGEGRARVRSGVAWSRA